MSSPIKLGTSKTCGHMTSAPKRRVTDRARENRESPHKQVDFKLPTNGSRVSRPPVVSLSSWLYDATMMPSEYAQSTCQCAGGRKPVRFGWFSDGLTGQHRSRVPGGGSQQEGRQMIGSVNAGAPTMFSIQFLLRPVRSASFAEGWEGGAGRGREGRGVAAIHPPIRWPRAIRHTNASFRNHRK